MQKIPSYKNFKPKNISTKYIPEEKKLEDIPFYPTAPNIHATRFENLFSLSSNEIIPFHRETYSDGSTRDIYPNGFMRTIHANGLLHDIHPNGTSLEYYPSSSEEYSKTGIIYYHNGDVFKGIISNLNRYLKGDLIRVDKENNKEITVSYYNGAIINESIKLLNEPSLPNLNSIPHIENEIIVQDSNTNILDENSEIKPKQKKTKEERGKRIRKKKINVDKENVAFLSPLILTKENPVHDVDEPKEQLPEKPILKDNSILSSLENKIDIAKTLPPVIPIEKESSILISKPLLQLNKPKKKKKTESSATSMIDIDDGFVLHKQIKDNLYFDGLLQIEKSEEGHLLPDDGILYRSHKGKVIESWQGKFYLKNKKTAAEKVGTLNNGVYFLKQEMRCLLIQYENGEKTSAKYFYQGKDNFPYFEGKLNENNFPAEGVIWFNDKFNFKININYNEEGLPLFSQINDDPDAEIHFKEDGFPKINTSHIFHYNFGNSNIVLTGKFNDKGFFKKGEIKLNENTFFIDKVNYLKSGEITAQVTDKTLDIEVTFNQQFVPQNAFGSRTIQVNGKEFFGTVDAFDVFKRAHISTMKWDHECGFVLDGKNATIISTIGKKEFILNDCIFNSNKLVKGIGSYFSAGSGAIFQGQIDTVHNEKIATGVTVRPNPYSISNQLFNLCRTFGVYLFDPSLDRFILMNGKGEIQLSDKTFFFGETKEARLNFGLLFDLNDAEEKIFIGAFKNDEANSGIWISKNSKHIQIGQKNSKEYFMEGLFISELFDNQYLFQFIANGSIVKVLVNSDFIEKKSSKEDYEFIRSNYMKYGMEFIFKIKDIYLEIRTKDTEILLNDKFGLTIESVLKKMNGISEVIFTGILDL